jgi:ribokinase
MKSIAQICVIGSANIDHIMRVPRLPEVGETVSDGVYLDTFGGKGANSAVGAARAGGHTRFVGCVGDDTGGRELRAELVRLGVDVTHLTTLPRQASGHALVLVGGAGKNYLAVAPGANFLVGPEHLAALETALPRGACVLLQNEIPPATNLAVLELARRRGWRVLFNFAPAIAFPLEALRDVEALIVNENEAEALLGLAPGALGDPLAAACELRDLGPTHVFVTLGAAGVALAGPDGAILVPGLRVDAVDTTAAGDIFCGSLAVALGEGRTPREAAVFATHAAAISVTRAGSMVSAPARAEIETSLAAVAAVAGA